MSNALHLHRLEISNYMRVDAFSVDADGKSVIIRAKNAEGKSSVIEAIWEALAGSSVKERPEPIHEGADKALIRIELADDDGEVLYIVEKHITPKGRRLVITTGEGKKPPGSAQALLDGFLDRYSLDPVAFLERRPQDQLDDVLQVCGIEPPVQQVRMITQLAPEHYAKADHPINVKHGESADKYLERLSADDFGFYYTCRRDINQEVTRIRGAVDKQRQEIERMQNGIAQVTNYGSLESMQQDLAVTRASNKEHVASAKKLSDLASDRALMKMKKEKDIEKRNTAMQQLRDLEAAIIKKKEELSDLETDVANSSFDEKEAVEAYDSHAKLHGTLNDNTDQIVFLEKKIGEAVSASKKIIERDHAVARHNELEAELEVASKRHAKADSILLELRSLRKGILEGIDLGVDGLSVEGGELRMNNKPFRQASYAERVKVSCAVAMKRNPRLKLLRVDNGEALDKDSKAYLLSLAAERGWQVVMACVADNTGLKVELVDKE